MTSTNNGLFDIQAMMDMLRQDNQRRETIVAGGATAAPTGGAADAGRDNENSSNTAVAVEGVPNTRAPTTTNNPIPTGTPTSPTAPTGNFVQVPQQQPQGAALPQTPPNRANHPAAEADSSGSGSGLTSGTGSTDLPDVFTPENNASNPLSSPESRRGNAPLAPGIAAAADANRAAMEVPHQYRLVRKLHATEEIWLVQRTSDDMEFVGRQWDVPRLNPDFDQLLERGAGDAVAAVLNHPNLISHIDMHQLSYWHGRDFEQRDYTISDYMDAGTLRSFIDKTLVLPKVNLRTGAVLQWLPESLVWHVATSLLSALTWLHEGVREEDVILWGDGGKARRGTEIETPMDRGEDWWPILHRDIRTDQVFFQQPRGIETYGSCKLGGFGRVFVSGHVHGRAAGTVVTSLAEASEELLRGVVLRAQAELQTRMDAKADPGEKTRLYEDYSAIDHGQRPYFKGTEMFKVGVILWQMMTRQLVPDPEVCIYCNVNHWTEIRNDLGQAPGDPGAADQSHEGAGEMNVQCEAWRTGVFQLNDGLRWLSKGADRDQPDAGYSPALIDLMSQLLDPQTFRRPVRTFDLLDAAKTGYLEWKGASDEGKRHVDHWDDMVQREKNRRKKEAHDRDIAIKQSGDRAQEYIQLAMGGATVV